MHIGMMNHPALPLIPQLQFAAEHGFNFIDLTLEPPQASRNRLKPAQVRRELAAHGLFAVGHTAWYLPFDSPFQLVQQAVAQELMHVVDFFAEIEVAKVNFHFLLSSPEKMFGCHELATFMCDTISPVIEYAGKANIHMMVENGIMTPNRMKIIDKVFKSCPELLFHLDIGHAFLNSDGQFYQQLLKRYRDRLTHVHLSDNNLIYDLHQPLFSGSIPWKSALKLLKLSGYDDTFTIEVFCPDPDYLIMSKEKFTTLWQTGLSEG